MNHHFNALTKCMSLRIVFRSASINDGRRRCFWSHSWRNRSLFTYSFSNSFIKYRNSSNSWIGDSSFILKANSEALLALRPKAAWPILWMAVILGMLEAGFNWLAFQEVSEVLVGDHTAATCFGDRNEHESSFQDFGATAAICSWRWIRCRRYNVRHRIYKIQKRVRPACIKLPMVSKLVN